jgi:hypothetical protein
MRGVSKVDLRVKQIDIDTIQAWKIVKNAIQNSHCKL